MTTNARRAYRKSIAVVVPAYNEAECVDELARRLGAVFDSLERYRFQVVVVENGSTDDTFERLLVVRDRDPRFKVLQLSRNFRMDGGLSAGLDEVDADAVILMAADLQDPPETIPRFIEMWEQGYENVYGIVTRRSGVPWLRRVNSRIFYWVIGRLTGRMIPANASDFRLLDRRVYEVVRSMEERNRFIRGLVAWAGFRSIGVEQPRQARHAGESKARSLHVVSLALKGIMAHSYVPLIVVPMAGLALFALSVVAIVALSVMWVVAGVPFAGFGTIVALILLMFGVLFCLLGIVSMYVGQIYEEVKQRPNFVVRRTVGLRADEERSELEASKKSDVVSMEPVRAGGSE